MNDLVVPAGEHSPALHIHVNPHYSMYHYLRREAELPIPLVREETAIATASMREALNRMVGPEGSNLGGYHGLWDTWEQPLARHPSIDAAMDGLRHEMSQTLEHVGSALEQAEAVFLETLWPERGEAVEGAIETIATHLVPHFAGIARSQSEQLSVAWPPRADAFLVADCYDRFEAYSKPLTIDATRSHGFELCETLIHESTHVADRYTKSLGQSSLEDRLMKHLLEAGISRFGAILDAQHAVIFASSGRQIRSFVEASHVDYAASRGLYDRLRVPSLPLHWEQFATGALGEEGLFEAIRAEIDQPR